MRQSCAHDLVQTTQVLQAQKEQRRRHPHRYTTPTPTHSHPFPLAKYTWVQRAINSAAELTGPKKDNLTPGRIDSLRKCLSLLTDAAEPPLIVTNWVNFTGSVVEEWFRKAKAHRTDIRGELREVEKSRRIEAANKHRNFLLNQGMTNSSAFRRRRLGAKRDPDGEAVLSKEGTILIVAEQIIERYGEYYRLLLEKEPTPPTPPRDDVRHRWINPQLIESNKAKLVQALGTDNIVTSPPSFEEIQEVILNGKPNSTPGRDGIQYGALQRASNDTIRLVQGIIGVWWRTRTLPKDLRFVEICSLHKKSDRLDLINKRGIGLVSKLILIMESVLLNRLTKALDKAGTRSRAQGGATSGIHALDTIATLINVISHAFRHNRALHILEFDLFKFFDTIPHRAFVDAHQFFGFHQDTIDLASLFWNGFRGTARSIYGRSPEFDIGLGNIQGLAGSPLRSSLVIDMFLLCIERQKRGYLFTTDNYSGMPHTTITNHNSTNPDKQHHTHQQ